ncbi:hypothetical protein KVT40_008032 [Elsinoe batatas]|uniref:Uncharacterized protein n=1 Tax=Elsinoe batatas TaxID=2601811 RepID=A0A8K0PB58_9PEZI|nr:hypothetical protein KVT40_008032 [Elsinoe batatas]
MSLVEIQPQDLFSLPASAYVDFFESPQHTDPAASETAAVPVVYLRPITSSSIVHRFADVAIERILSSHPSILPTDHDFAIIVDLFTINEAGLTRMKRQLNICLDDRIAGQIAAAAVVQLRQFGVVSALQNIAVFLQARRPCVPPTEVVSWWIDQWPHKYGFLGLENERMTVPKAAVLLRRSRNIRKRGKLVDTYPDIGMKLCQPCYVRWRDRSRLHLKIGVHIPPTYEFKCQHPNCKLADKRQAPKWYFPDDESDFAGKVLCLICYTSTRTCKPFKYKESVTNALHPVSSQDTTRGNAGGYEVYCTINMGILSTKQTRLSRICTIVGWASTRLMSTSIPPVPELEVSRLFEDRVQRAQSYLADLEDPEDD